MAQVRWTLGALQDVEIISGQIGKTSAERAAAFEESIELVLDRLRTFPMSGRDSMFDFAADIREVSIRPYRFFYRLVDIDVVQVIAILDGRRNVGRVMRVRWSKN